MRNTLHNVQYGFGVSACVLRSRVVAFACHSHSTRINSEKLLDQLLEEKLLGTFAREARRVHRKIERRHLFSSHGLVCLGASLLEFVYLLCRPIGSAGSNQCETFASSSVQFSSVGSIVSCAPGWPRPLSCLR